MEFLELISSFLVKYFSDWIAENDDLGLLYSGLMAGVQRYLSSIRLREVWLRVRRSEPGDRKQVPAFCTKWLAAR